MTLPKNGRSKKVKHIKCSVCGRQIELNEDNIEHCDGVRFIICGFCGNEEIIKK